ncbi:MAG: CRISPR-associated protein Csm7 [Sedimenticola sp.]|nr:MAG: CRISPR-associated protein Csm7 [Sedimenticola sp.]
METLLMQIRPLTAFGGQIKGDTLFGQFCWAMVHRYGESMLTELLHGYTKGDPYLVCSDAFPQGYIPRPALPFDYYDRLLDVEHKRIKKRQWLPLEKVMQPIEKWLGYCRTEEDIAKEFGLKASVLSERHAQPHNSIHRKFNTTIGGNLSPYSLPQHWFTPGMLLDIWLLFDPDHLNITDLCGLAENIGKIGFGRDASIGLGKFKLENCCAATLPHQVAWNARLTLAPSAPQGLGLQAEHCYYEPFTRFGRHGDRAVLTGKPFKNPILMADTGAVMVETTATSSNFVGQGLGGGKELSNAIDGTVHQGYAPCIGIYLKEAAYE